MTTIRKLAALALTLATLTACGGGDSPPAPVPAPPPAPTPAPAPVPACTPRQVTVVLAGDSTQYGIDGGSPTEERAVHNPGYELQQVMDTLFGPGNVVVTDIGVPGTVADDASRPAIAADVVVANYGINDARYGYSVAEFTRAMRGMPLTIVETPLPRLDGDPLLVLEEGYLEAERSWGLPVADVNAYVRSLPGWADYFSTPYSGHPTDALYKLVVDNVLAPAVARQVAPLRCVAAPL